MNESTFTGDSDNPNSPRRQSQWRELIVEKVKTIVGKERRYVRGEKKTNFSTTTSMTGLTDRDF
jgi:hypothetical protein